MADRQEHRVVQDRSDATVVTVRTHGRATRTVYEPRSDGRVDVVEETLTKGGEWREVGHDIAESVAVENAD